MDTTTVDPKGLDHRTPPCSAAQPSVTSPRRPLSLTKRLVFSLIPVCALLGFAEVIARLFVAAPTQAQRFDQIQQIIVYLGNKPGESIFEPDPDCFWHLKPNVTLPMDRGSSWGGMMSNSHGMRSREVSVADAQQRLRVLCFGDSSTFAFGVGFADAWPNQLQEILDDEQPQQVEVLNAGIPGQSSYQGRQRLGRELNKWQPHLAFITFGNNDGWRWDDRADKDHAKRSPRTDQLSFLNHSRAWQWLATGRQQLVQAYSAREQLKWAQQASWNYFDPNSKWTPRVSVEDFAINLRAMVTECQQHDCQPILIVWPDQRQLLGNPTWRPPYQDAMRQVADEMRIECLDLVPLFEEKAEWSVARFIPNDVVHLDRSGNRFVADAVEQLIHKIQARQSAAQPTPESTTSRE